MKEFIINAYKSIPLVRVGSPVAPSLWERILSTEDEGQWFSNVFYPVNSIVIYANLIFIISYFYCTCQRAGTIGGCHVDNEVCP